MTNDTDSNHLNTRKNTKKVCIPSFVAKKPCLNNFMRESAKNAEKTLKTQFST